MRMAKDSKSRIDRLEIVDLSSTLNHEDPVAASQISEDGGFVGLLLRSCNLLVARTRKDRRKANDVLLLERNVQEFRWCHETEKTTRHGSGRSSICLLTEAGILKFFEIECNEGEVTARCVISQELDSRGNYNNDNDNVAICHTWYDSESRLWKVILWSCAAVVTLDYSRETGLPSEFVPLLEAADFASLGLIGCSATESLAVAADSSGVFYIIDILSRNITHRCSISSAEVSNVRDVSFSMDDDGPFQKFAMDNDLHVGVLVDIHNNLYICQLADITDAAVSPLDEEVKLQHDDTSLSKATINDDDELVVDGIDGPLGDSMWLYEFDGLMNRCHTDSLTAKVPVAIDSSAVAYRLWPALEWMHDLQVGLMLVETSSLVLELLPTDHPNDKLLSVEELTCGAAVLVSFDDLQMTIDRFDAPTVVGISHCKSLPHFLLDGMKFFLPTFGIPQQDIICHVIQYAGIAKAEALCKKNMWDQFFIPLHILDVGLQHKQLDTVAFFLKSRENAFSRQLKSLLSLQSPPASSLSPVLSSSFSNSPALTRRQRSVSSGVVDSNELLSAIEMLMRTLQNSSKKKHKEFFFQNLLTMTFNYVNGLLRDGIDALALFESLEMGQKSIRRDSTGDSNEPIFNMEIDESIEFLTEKILELRKYLKEPSMTLEDEVDGDDVAVLYGTEKLPSEKVAQMNTIKQKMLHGDIGSLQSSLLQMSVAGDGSPCDGLWDSLKEFALRYVYELLSDRQFGDAVVILKNLGVDVAVILKAIYKGTCNHKLRSFMFDHLREEFACLHEKEVADYQYMCNFVSAYNQRPVASHGRAWKQIVFLPDDDGDDGSIADREATLRDVNSDNINLEVVEQWDEVTRQKVLLDLGLDCLKRKEVNISSGVLWSYLTSHNNKEVLMQWLSNDSTLPFPPLDGQSICNQKLICSENLRATLNRELAKHNIYIDNPYDTFPELLSTLCQSLNLFSQPHPLLKQEHLPGAEREKQRVVFDQKVVEFCINWNLDRLLYAYLDFYCIDTSDLEEQSAMDRPSWVAMLYAFRGASKDPSLIYRASLTNAQYVLNLPYANINGILLAKRPLMALATALLSGDGVLDLSGSNSQMSFNPKLLSASLEDHPKLRSVLCGVGNSNNQDANNGITMFKLLHDNTVLDLSKLFGWLLGNPYFVKGDSIEEVPSFSHPELSKRYGLQIKLDWHYYLQQGRGAFAYYALLKQCSDDRGISKARKHHLYYKIYSVAMASFDQLLVTSACIVFLSLLGSDTTSLKVDIEAGRFVFKHISTKRNLNLQQCKEFKHTVATLLCDGGVDAIQEVADMIEETTNFVIDSTEIDRTTYKALYMWKIYVQFCECHKTRPSNRCLVYYAKRALWLQFMCMLHLHQYLPEEGIHALEEGMTNTVLKEHLVAVIKNVKETHAAASREERQQPSRRRSRKSKPKSTTPKERNVRAQFYSKLGAIGGKQVAADPLSPDSAEKQQVQKSTESITRAKREASKVDEVVLQQDVFSDNVLDVLLECEKKSCPWKYLLTYAVALRQPFIAILAGSFKDANLLDCVCVWLVVACGESLLDIIYMEMFDASSSGDPSCIEIQKHAWKCEDLDMITMLLLKSGIPSLKVLHQGYKMFLPDSPLTTLLLFWVNFVTVKAFDDCKQNLHALSHSVIGSCAANTNIPSALDETWTRQMVYNVAKEILLNCKSKFYQWKLLNLYCESNMKAFFFDYGLDCSLLDNVAATLISTNAHAQLGNLLSAEEGTRRDEQDRVLEVLLTEKEFSKAKEIANLFQRSTENIVIREVEQELISCQASLFWDQLESRVSFWNKCNDMMLASGCRGQQFVEYFQDLSRDLAGITYDERAVLLTMALKWQQRVVANGESDQHNSKKLLSAIEQQIWIYRIKSEQEKTNIPSVEKRPSKSDAVKKRRSVSIVGYQQMTKSELLQPQHFNDDMPMSMSSTLTHREEIEAFESLVGKLLDEFEVTQARRVAQQFGQSTKDLDIVLSCIFLAQGSFAIDSLDEGVKSLLAKTPTRHLYSPSTPKLEQTGSFGRSASISSVATSPGAIMVDWVLVEEIQDALEKLTSRCKFGRKCCQRIFVSFNVSQLLNVPYASIVVEPPATNLSVIMNSELEHRFVILRQFVKAYEMTTDEIAQFVADYTIAWFKATSNGDLSSGFADDQYVFSSPPSKDDVQFLIQLVDDSTRLGHLFFQAATSLLTATGKNHVLSAGVEILICAHSCFTLSCNMEGISDVLRIAKQSSLLLKDRDMFNVMVRLLVGIGRFKDMSYIFEILRRCYHFELLFRQSFEKENLLKTALLDFIRRHHPDDAENFNLIALHFHMHMDVAKQLEETGQEQIKAIKPRLKANANGLEKGLKAITLTFTYAAENYKKELCHKKARRCMRLAQLTELQHRLLQSGVVVIGLSKTEVLQLLNKHNAFFEALLIAHAYDLAPDFTWADPLYNIVILNNDRQYLKGFLSLLPITTALAAAIATKFKSERQSSQAHANMKTLLPHVKELRLRQRLAHDLGFNDLSSATAEQAFLKDTMYSGKV